MPPKFLVRCSSNWTIWYQFSIQSDRHIYIHVKSQKNKRKMGMKSKSLIKCYQFINFAIVIILLWNILMISASLLTFKHLIRAGNIGGLISLWTHIGCLHTTWRRSFIANNWCLSFFIPSANFSTKCWNIQGMIESNLRNVARKY